MPATSYSEILEADAVDKQKLEYKVVGPRTVRGELKVRLGVRGHTSQGKPVRAEGGGAAKRGFETCRGTRANQHSPGRSLCLFAFRLHPLCGGISITPASRGYFQVEERVGT